MSVGFDGCHPCIAIQLAGWFSVEVEDCGADVGEGGGRQMV